MDWLHLEMPFVLSLLPSFMLLSRYFILLVVGRRCVFIICWSFVLSPLAGVGGNPIFISDTSKKNED